ncbi:hypothetical protein N7495_004651 [Penicillium taxi]|uniref:uncharacterized protein n=1 Tax=Penicillium taxi TaxID=168475 RepID=UPI002545A068|nr:uncharacterized protein N7495_004651 [Penicillium taxi]KAJ5899907.1 hypothetical protein N7495_004651 [Penicillium taxi]
MHFLKLTSLLAFLSTSALAAPSELEVEHDKPHTPTPPGLTYLYTSYIICAPNVYDGQGPSGIRGLLPIHGGNFTGPLLNGEILDVGGDWGTADPQTGIFSADSRYNMRTHDGAYLLVTTSGSGQPDGSSHVRVKIETGAKDYYWLNNILAVGVLNPAAHNETTITLKIDAFHLTGEWNSTTFVNGTTYP